MRSVDRGWPEETGIRMNFDLVTAGKKVRAGDDRERRDDVSCRPARTVVAVGCVTGNTRRTRRRCTDGGVGWRSC